MKLHILAIAAHPDDLELGAAGTLIKHARMGQAVGILDLTKGELGTRGNAEIRLQEAQDAAKVMGLAVRENVGMEDGFFMNDREHQLKLVQYIRKYQPDIVIANALEDRHPDHGKGGRLIADACFLAGLRKIDTRYEAKSQEPWRPKRVFHMIQDRFLEPNIIVDISDTMDQKMESILCYKSQFHDPNSSEPMTYIASSDFMDNVKARNSLVGKRIGARYGEGFICENVPGIDNLDQLLYPQMA
ncbi:MAG: bacillithiol biosynthesis deacetylase BshB1 [Sphingobacteriales bacterium]|nr:MAG: bacillithiol biosynthesis deacetylase BshB1 [Sphingobacteriales bacterium]